MNKPIYVTESFLPPLSEYNHYLKQIWKSKQLTNQGPLVKELEQKLRKYLGVKYVHFVTNGTLALQLALRALNITEGEIITTPFSYVATVSSILWERCTPVFIDIDPLSLCINPDLIEQAITKKTKAIMPVHVFGIPCDVQKIAKIAKKHKLKVIYDAAHAFGVKINNKGVFNFGDISIGSFHATKVFQTIEGGCLATNSKQISNKIELIKRFGHQGDNHIMLGINAKASEFQAAMGLCNLKYLKKIVQSRRKVTELYNKALANNITKPVIPRNVTYNYGYYPIILKNEKQLLKVVKALNKENIYPRRYFYPSLNLISYLKCKSQLHISEDVSRKVLCLPMYSRITVNRILNISNIVNIR